MFFVHGAYFMSALRSVIVCALFVLPFMFCRWANATTVYFEVGEINPFHGDSYILPLENPSDIAHAQALILQGISAGQTIAVAQIAAGSDGINRNYLAPGQPLWSWHVTNFLGFADLAAEVLDGTPTQVENNVAGWIANTGGEVGFYNYTVVAQVVPEPSTFLLATIALTCETALLAAPRKN
jgi:hypothetical protein